jgi:type I restriction enzyme, S subunit
VSPGYKQTEVGVIPDDWQVKLLPEVCKFRGGKAHEQHISDLGRYVCVNSKFISSDGAVRKYSTANFCPAKKGDVLMVMSDLPNGRALAKTYLVEADDTYAVNQRVCALSTYRDSAEYLFFVLNRNPYFIKFDDGVNQTHLLNPVFEKCPLALPPTVDEQRAIAAALSDVDALLGGLDRLIAKKRNLKQAAMQQLITGETRLPGFHGDWEVRRLRALATIAQGQVDPRVMPYRSMPLIGPEHVESGTGRLLTRRTALEQGAISGKYLFKKGDVVYGKINPYLRKAFLADFDGLCSADMYPLRAVGGVAPGFLLATILGREFSTYSESVSVRSGMPKINREEMAGFSTKVPKDLDEQTAIATVLSDVDAELSALEVRREKTRSLKQGIMQELLTGRTRLV